MLSYIAKALFVATSLAPLLVTYPFLIPDMHWHWKLGGALGALILVGLNAYLLRYSRKNLQIRSFSAATIKNADQQVLAFMVAYLMPIFTGALSLSSALFLAVFLYFVFFHSNSYHFNPLLGLFGYHFYEVTTPSSLTYILLTRKHLVNIEQVQNVVYITDYMVLDTKKE